MSVEIDLCIGEGQRSAAVDIYVAIVIRALGRAAVDSAAQTVDVQVGMDVSRRQDMVRAIAELSRRRANVSQGDNVVRRTDRAVDIVWLHNQGLDCFVCGNTDRSRIHS